MDASSPAGKPQQPGLPVSRCQLCKEYNEVRLKHICRKDKGSSLKSQAADNTWLPRTSQPRNTLQHAPHQCGRQVPKALKHKPERRRVTGYPLLPTEDQALGMVTVASSTLRAHGDQHLVCSEWGSAPPIPHLPCQLP